MFLRDADGLPTPEQQPRSQSESNRLGFDYAARHNYTGGIQMCRKIFGTPWVNRKWDWAILTHVNCRYDYYKKSFSDRKSRSVSSFFKQPDLGLRWDFTPRVSRPDKTKPTPGADFSISPSGFNFDMQSTPTFPRMRRKRWSLHMCGCI